VNGVFNISLGYQGVLTDEEDCVKQSTKIGYPVMIKVMAS
jgi:acetyl/propionyl-CoA carboxylase alpha subunit